MNLTEYAQFDATGLSELVRNNEVTAQELAENAREAARLINPKINAVLEVFDDVIEDPYKDGMQRNGAFYGVPMLLKDIGSGMQGRRQELGAKFLQGMVHGADDTLTSNWRNAGFNLIGRTSLPMFGLAPVSDSLLHGITRNPWHLEYTPSGSSGGSAAAVAAGIVPIASASDGGGSTRSPAGYTGLIGLKPSRGRLPLSGGHNELANHFAVEGILTRTVRDTAGAYDAMCQMHPGDSFMPIAPPARSYLEDCASEPGPQRIALLTGPCERDGPMDAEVLERVESVARHLESLGHIVTPTDDRGLCDWQAMWRSVEVNWIGGAQLWADSVRAMGMEITQETIEPVFWYLMEAAKRYGLADFQQVRAENALYTRQFGECFQNYDLILSPVEAVTAPKCGPDSPVSPLFPANSADDAIRFIDRMTDNARFMTPANEAGFPAISIPTGRDSRGVPLGVQLAAAWCREDLLIQMAAQLEQSRPEWFNQTPPHHVTNL